MEEMKVVSVMYYNDKIRGYVGNAYSYIDPTGDLKVGEKVIVAAGADNERKKAIVVDTDVPQEKIPEQWRGKLKSVIGRSKE